MATPTLISDTGDQKVCKKKNLSWLFGADRKICPRVTVWHHKAVPSDAKQWSRGTDFSIHTSHSRKILIISDISVAEIKQDDEGGLDIFNPMKNIEVKMK